MHRRAVLLTPLTALLLLLALLTLGGSAPVAAEFELPGPVDESHLISLRYGDIDTRIGELSLPDGLGIDAYSGEVAGYYLVQYIGPILSDWRSQTEATGARVVAYLPNNTYVVAATGDALDAVRGLPAVQWVGIYQPAHRVAPELLAAKDGGEQTLVVLTFGGADVGAVRSAVETQGGQMLNQDENEMRGYLRVRVPGSAVPALAGINGVAWIEPWFEPTLTNIEARRIMDVEDTVWAVQGMRGVGQVIAVADTGLDVGRNDASMNDDFEGRITATFAYGRPNDWSDPNGHGTHVAGSVLGSGRNSGGNAGSHNYGGSQAGVAPEANLVFQSTEGADGSLSGLGSLNQVFGDAYTAGARVHTNSWGHPANGTYDTAAFEVDQFVWTHPDLTVLFSAGNNGVDADHNGVVDLDSITSPGVAKNVMTVGASENLHDTGGYNPGGACPTWGGCWPRDFPAEPIWSDALSNQANGMAAFSSRGPVDRNRIKPDVVAPGTNILSVRTHQYAHAMDAESGPGSWTSNGWVITNTLGYGSTHSWATGAYGKNAQLMLTSPAIDIRTGVDLITYWTRHALGSGDRGAVEYGSNGIWQQCEQLTGQASTWAFHTCRIDYSLVNLAQVQVRFRLVNNGSNPGTGWFVDEIRMTSDAWGFYTENGAPSDNYYYMGGTSMATPLVAGAAALTREAYAKKGHEPSGALVRATLVNGATNISPGQYPTGPQEIPAGVPNNVTGWGRVNVQDALTPAAPQVILFKDIAQARGLQTNGTHVYRYEVRNRSVPFRATLVWSDHPGLPSANNTALNNDLDLEVVRPDGTRLFPNGGSAADVTNNTEDVFIPANTVPSGVYVITIRGRNVPFGPQGYALVMRGGELRELPRIAVNPPQYDDMGAVLQEMGYPWQQISDSDFTQYSKIQPYEVLFANCSGAALQTGPSAANSLRQFVANGGSVYASDWAYTYISNGFPGYINFRSDPLIGNQQLVTARITDPGLANYLNPTNPPSMITLNYNLSSWAVIDDVAAATKVYLRGTVQTSQGQLTDKPLLVSFAPLASSAGRVTYTTFHNEAQQSALEKKLLEYLVLVPSTSQLATQAEQVVTGAGLNVKQTNINTIDPGQTSSRVNYKLNAPSPLMFVLNWGGSTLRLSVFRPDGSLYRRVDSSAPPLIVSTPDGTPGTWQYEVTGVSVPYNKYPYVVVIGDKAPLGSGARTYLPSIQRNAGAWQQGAGSAGHTILDLASWDGACTGLFAASNAGLMGSLDGGRTWTFGSQPAIAEAMMQAGAAPLYDEDVQTTAQMITSVALCPGEPELIYVGTWGAGIYRSTDFGASWVRVVNGLSDGWIYDLAISPTHCNTVYAATSSGGVFKTTNGGGAWYAQNSGLGDLKTHAIALAQGGEARLYAGTTAGVYTSDNGAVSWRATAPLPAGVIHALAVSPANPAIVFAGAEAYGVTRSWDAGGSWYGSSLSTLSIRSLAIDPAAPQIVFAGANDTGFYRTLDGGDSWVPFSDNLGSRSVKAVLQTTGSCRILLAGTTDGIWYRGN